MRRFIIASLAAAAVAAVAPGVASARPLDPATTIPVPHPITTALDGVPTTELYDGGAGLPYLGVSHPYNAGDWQSTLHEFADGPNSTYQAELARIDRIADRWIVRKARDRRHRAHHHRGRKLAVVLDIDETSLSNLTAIEADNFTFGTNSKNEANNEVGQAIAPTLELFNDAKQHRVAVFFITGRSEAQRDHTVHNLQTQGYDGWRQLYLKPATPTMTTVQYKSGARKDVERQGYRIIANIGDQYSDLAGGHARRAFKLANPFYFLP
jgi:hypothetical protein